MLCYDPNRQGFEIKWLPYGEAIEGGEFKVVRVGDVVPCVVTVNGVERLGCVNMKEERAGVSWGGKEDVYTGAQVQQFMVLCRN